MKIGLYLNQITVGTFVNYYSWINEENDTHSTAKETQITSEPWWCCGEYVCKVDGVSGGVCINHLELR